MSRSNYIRYQFIFIVVITDHVIFYEITATMIFSLNFGRWDHDILRGTLSTLVLYLS